MKRRLILSLLVFGFIFSLVGGGFSLFIFNLNHVDASQNIDISVESKDESGDINLVYLNEEGEYEDELSDSKLKTKLEFNFDNVIFKRNDQPSQEKTFVLKYSPVIDVINKKLSIKCFIKIKDNDDKGVIINTSPQYPKSNSIIDIFKPSEIITNIIGDSAQSSYLVSEDSALDHLSIYSSFIYQNKTITDLNPIYFEIKFVHIYLSRGGLSFAPSSSTSEDALKKKIESNINAMKNSSIELVFSMEVV